MSTSVPAATPVKKPRGRPPKRRKEQQEAELLLQLNNDDFSPTSCSSPQSCEDMAADASAAASPVISNGEMDEDAKRVIVALRSCISHMVSTNQQNLIKLINSEIRKDPRTEELKELKQQVASLSQSTKEDKEMEKRILEDAANLKRIAEEAGAKIEPALKKLATLEQQIKALMLRNNATEERIKSLEAMK